MTKISDEQLIDVIKKNAGVVVSIVRTIRRKYGVEITRDAIYKRKEANPLIAAAFEEAENEILDIAENKLISAIQNGELKAAMFYLRLKGKKRGYTERQEISGTEGKPVAVNPFEGMSTEQLLQIAGLAGTSRQLTHVCRIPAEK